jgi:branched-chain amino acid transport system ATP-binding protein
MALQHGFRAGRMLEISSLRAGYGPAEVLRGIDLMVRPGEIVAVLGANGAGKTTLNRAISGVIKVCSGTIRFHDEEIAGLSPAAIVSRGLIHVPEGRRIFPNMSVRENLIMGSYARAKQNRARNLERVFATFPRLLERARQAAGTLSGGEQQMLAIGRGMMAEPRLLILDEPSLGLSPLLVEEMFTLIGRINAEGLAVMLVEQNVMQSLALAHRAYIIEQGEIVLSGAAAALAADPALQKAYLGL